MHLAAWLAFVPVALAVSLFPGPAFLSVLVTGARLGFRVSLVATAGVLLVDAVYFLVAALGLGALLTTSQLAFEIVKWIGAAYLVYLAIRSLFAIGNEPASAPDIGLHAFRTSMMTQLANPKLIIFIAALVPPFIDTHAPTFMQFVILGSTFVASDALVYLIVGAFASRAGRLVQGRGRTAIQRVTGMAMLGAAARIVLER